jgi:hypothetical protein
LLLEAEGSEEIAPVDGVTHANAGNQDVAETQAEDVEGVNEDTDDEADFAVGKEG